MKDIHNLMASMERDEHADKLTVQERLAKHIEDFCEETCNTSTIFTNEQVRISCCLDILCSNTYVKLIVV